MSRHCSGMRDVLSCFSMNIILFQASDFTDAANWPALSEVVSTFMFIITPADRLT